jgi:Fur family zinc uptake transcriptional regulator
MARGTTATGLPVVQLVLSALAEGKRPLGAYQILDQLRPHGVTAPPTVYRALERLIAEGKAHRVESLNAFIACAQAAHRGWAAFAICRHCGAVDEFTCEDAATALGCWAAERRFDVDGTAIEMIGTCADCGSPEPNAAAGG